MGDGGKERDPGQHQAERPHLRAERDLRVDPRQDCEAVLPERVPSPIRGLAPLLEDSAQEGWCSPWFGNSIAGHIVLLHASVALSVQDV